MNSQTPSALLKHASSNRRMGANEDALAELIAFYEYQDQNLEDLSEYYLLKSTSFPIELVRLASDYHPASVFLNKVISNARQSLFQDEHALNAFRLLFVIYRTMGSTQAILHLFSEIEQKDPELASSAFHIAKLLFLRNREYSICARYLTLANIVDSCVLPLRRSDSHQDPWIATRRKERLAMEINEYLQFLIQQGRKKDAKELVELILANADSSFDLSLVNWSVEG